MNIGTKVRIDETRFKSNSEYVGRVGFISYIYNAITPHPLFIVKIQPLNRSVAATKVTAV